MTPSLIFQIRFHPIQQLSISNQKNNLFQFNLTRKASSEQHFIADIIDETQFSSSQKPKASTDIQTQLSMIKTLSKTDFSSSILTEKNKMFLASASSVQFGIELNLFMCIIEKK